MKNKALSLVLTIILLASAFVLLLNAKGYDFPTPGGQNIFGIDEIMYPGHPGTKYHNAFIHPDVWNPIDGWYEHWTHAYFEEATYKGVDCVKVSIDPVSPGIPILDFNYYQWNATYYEPSLDATKYGWLKIEYAYSGGADMDYMKFHASKDVTPLGASNLKSAFKTWDIANGNGEWQEAVVYLGDMIFEDGTSWDENTIRQFRLHLFEDLNVNQNPDACIYIAGFGFFETKEAAEAWEAEMHNDFGTPEVSASSAQGYLGDTVKIEVSLKNNPGVVLMRLGVSYDESALTLTEVRDAGKLGSSVHSNKFESPYKLLWQNGTATSNYTANGTVATLVFKINDNATPGNYPIEITYNASGDILNKDLDQVYFKANAGSVKVSELECGDVNGDGDIGVLDLAYLMRHVANWVGYGDDAIKSAAADVTGDGKVEALDSIILARHLADWVGYESLPLTKAEPPVYESGYAVVDGFTDFELNSYAVLSAYVNGVKKELKVTEVKQLDATGGYDSLKIESLSYNKLADLLGDIEGLYTYTIDNEGNCSIVEQGVKYRLGDYLNVRNGAITFKDYNEVEPVGGWGIEYRGNILRVNSSTKIYTDDGTNVKLIDAKFGKEWNLEGVTADTMFYVDKLGFGDAEAEYTDRPSHGIASIVYFLTSDEVVSTDGYKLVFVDDTLQYTKTGTAEEFGIGDGEESGTYTKFSVDGEAYGLLDFRAEDVLYVKGSLLTALNPGVYLVDADNVVADFAEIDDIKETRDYALTIATGITAKFRVADIKAADIDLFGYNDIVVTGLCVDNTGVKAVTFKDYVYNSSTNKYQTVTKSNSALTEYLGESTVKVLIAANNLTSFSQSASSWPGNTLRGIIIDDLVA